MKRGSIPEHRWDESEEHPESGWLQLAASALTLESLHLFASGSTGGLRSGPGSVSTCRASAGR